MNTRTLLTAFVDVLSFCEISTSYCASHEARLYSLP